jgi:DnaK suppressor protein
MSIDAAIDHINATMHLHVTRYDLTGDYVVDVPPARPGRYLVAARGDADIWHVAHFDGSNWIAPGVHVQSGWVWRGLNVPTQPAPEEGLDVWALRKLNDMRAKTVMAMLSLREEAPAGLDGATRGDEADISSARESVETSLRAVGVLQRQLAEIDAAIGRLGRGEYGICEMTGEEIPVARLRANPMARLTVEAQEHLERNGRLFAARHDGNSATPEQRACQINPVPPC